MVRSITFRGTPASRPTSRRCARSRRQQRASRPPPRRRGTARRTATRTRSDPCPPCAGRRRVDLVDEVGEGDLVGNRFVKRDVQVLRRHEPADDRVDRREQHRGNPRSWSPRRSDRAPTERIRRGAAGSRPARCRGPRSPRRLLPGAEPARCLAIGPAAERDRRLDAERFCSAQDALQTRPLPVRRLRGKQLLDRPADQFLDGRPI